MIPFMAFIRYGVILSHMSFSVIAAAQQAIILQSEKMALYAQLMCARLSEMHSLLLLWKPYKHAF